MDESQTNTLGSKMRGVYDDLASEAPVPAAVPKHPSRRLRRNRSFAGATARRTASVPGNIVAQRPMASLLIAVGVGYLLARL